MLPDALSIAPRPEFWHGLATGRFLLLYCESCNAWHAPWASRCARCAAVLDWLESSGVGTVYSFMERHATGTDSDTLTYAVIALDVGLNMMGTLRLPPDALRVGDRVGPAPRAEPPASLEGLPEFVPLAASGSAPYIGRNS